MHKNRKFSKKSWDKLLNGLITKINLGICDLYILTGKRYMALITSTNIYIASSALEQDIYDRNFKVNVLRQYPCKGKYLAGYRLLRDKIPCSMDTKTKDDPDFFLNEPPGLCRGSSKKR